MNTVNNNPEDANAVVVELTATPPLPPALPPFISPPPSFPLGLLQMEEDSPPPPPLSPPLSSESSSDSDLVLVIGLTVGGALLAAVLCLACVVAYRRVRNARAAVAPAALPTVSQTQVVVDGVRKQGGGGKASAPPETEPTPSKKGSSVTNSLAIHEKQSKPPA